MKRYIVLAIALLPVACGLPANVVVLTPDEDGGVGKATITTAGREVPLNKPYDAAGGSSGRAFAAKPAEVQSEFGDVLAATPRPPKVFIIAFLTGQAVIDPKSQPDLAAAIAAAKNTANADISVVGHADATGSNAENQAISLQRANLVRDALVAAGVSADIIQVTYHGSNNPRIPTAKGVSEPRNRRVEVTVR